MSKTTKALPMRTPHPGIQHVKPGLARITEAETGRSIAWCAQLGEGDDTRCIDDGDGGDHTGAWEVFSLKQMRQLDNPTGYNPHFMRLGDAAQYAGGNFHADDHITHPDDEPDGLG